MGYGRSVSRFVERKRVVADEDIGPLVATDMTRCIQCTRCVRFTAEIAGTYELGGMRRGENLQIGTYDGKPLTTELSGNVIDVCPVGALTNKVFRFRARAWELVARESLGYHDALGSATCSCTCAAARSCAPCRATTKRSTSAGCRIATAIRTRACTPHDRAAQPLVRDGDGWREAQLGRSAGQGREDPARRRRRPARRARASGDLERGGRVARPPRRRPRHRQPRPSPRSSCDFVRRRRRRSLRDAGRRHRARPTRSCSSAATCATNCRCCTSACARRSASAARRCTWSIRSISTSPSMSPSKHDRAAVASSPTALARASTLRGRAARRGRDRRRRRRDSAAHASADPRRRARASPRRTTRSSCRIPQGANAVGLAAHGVLPAGARRRRRCSPMRAAPTCSTASSRSLDFADQAQALQGAVGRAGRRLQPLRVRIARARSPT